MKKAVIVYWSGTGNTEAMAKAVAEGVREGSFEATVLEVAQANAEDIANYDLIALGCPSMGDEVLEESEFEPFFTQLEQKLSGKKVALFGSYDWGDGQWMRDWVQRSLAAGAEVFKEGLIMQGAPNEQECTVYGREFAAS